MMDKIDYSKYIKLTLLEFIKRANSPTESIDDLDQSSMLKSIREEGIGNLNAIAFKNTLNDNLYVKLFPYLYNTFEKLGVTSGEFVYISIFLTNLIKFCKPSTLKSDIKTIYESLNNPYIQNNSTIKPEMQSLYELLKILDISNSISHIICVMRHCIKNKEEKEKAIIISSVLNTLSIYEKHPFLTLDEANKEADRNHNKKSESGKKLDRYKDGRTIIYERIKYYYSAEKKSLNRIMAFHSDSEYFQEFFKGV